MENISHKIIYYYCLLILEICVLSNGAIRTKIVHHLENHKFASEEYLDPDIDERDSGLEPPISPLDEPFHKNTYLPIPMHTNVSDKLDPNIKWDQLWGVNLNFGQISAVTIDPYGNIGIFHRGERIWDASTFGSDNKFITGRGPIRDNTIILLDKNGKVLREWGRNMFYLPHGMTIDSLGNYWITDVAMHQVFKFDAKDLEQHKQQMRRRYNQRTSMSETIDINNLFANSLVKPSLILGEAFQPGNDNIRFCKPTATAIQSNGDFFVSDGYCNSRIIKFNKNGERILQWGRTWGFEGKPLYQNPPPSNAFLVPHALALAEEYDYIFIADRENARISCNFASNGSFHREYKNAILGEAIYSIAYAKDRLYLINGNRLSEGTHVRGFVLNIHTGEILSQFGPHMDMSNPHDIAVTFDEREIYVVELNVHKIYKFNQDTKNLNFSLKLVQSKNTTEAHSTLLQDGSIVQSKKSSQKTLVIVAIITALFFIGFCIFLAALLARYQKRAGCFFPIYTRRANWDVEKDNFKLKNLLEPSKRLKFFEGRPNTRDFSKLNTEPETSDDEILQNSLEKLV
ncbi:PREDICTED: peptidyl-alpha-hydroxyglycine alpha-amidating lyase 1 [Ceratosolen solmsi marchali]|uniref:peptidylamidoglycolate lyase n=1 Tax=Ceratosolen solmsi marchali TaxID=326594 RepID=A0AAJ6YF35_9HYME|nr:PREDICTED: peptidyl-alpha-hydroxyglycine alpha-amidating lyase 1 [Ceratosolen solmsi marchali]